MNLIEAAAALARFGGVHLTETLSDAETRIRGATVKHCEQLIREIGADEVTLRAAGLMKQAAGQINVVVHALGILMCLPHLLNADERVEYVSLGAGNTGRLYDLETSTRIAEFKFINWRGGAEAIRQNQLFKDFYLLAEAPTTKLKFLYVLGTEHPLKFLTGGRAFKSVLSRNSKVQKHFEDKYGSRFARVREYYTAFKDAVIIEDVSTYLGPLVSIFADAPTSEEEA